MAKPKAKPAEELTEEPATETEPTPDPVPDPPRRSLAQQFHDNVPPPASQSKVSTGEAPHPDDAGKGVR